ncbi:MAG: hypothetical protein P4M01_02400 [Acidobacteriota bacterium]|nr:hypothetical protein [Acidobacteriota bacterium]
MASMAEGQLAFEGSAGDFQSLEEKVYRTIQLLKTARTERAAAEAETALLQGQLEAKVLEISALQSQVEALRNERMEARSRIEKLMGEVDTILEQE